MRLARIPSRAANSHRAVDCYGAVDDLYCVSASTTSAGQDGSTDLRIRHMEDHGSPIPARAPGDDAEAVRGAASSSGSTVDAPAFVDDEGVGDDCDAAPVTASLARPVDASSIRAVGAGDPLDRAAGSDVHAMSLNECIRRQVYDECSQYIETTQLERRIHNVGFTLRNKQIRILVRRPGAKRRREQ
jgi:hypothetical protein